MAKKRKKSEGTPGSPAWMATFADMMTLLLCFFVMLVSMSTFEISKYRDVIHSIQGAMGLMVQPQNVIIKREVQFPRMGGDKQVRSKAAMQARRIRETIREYHKETTVRVDLIKDGFSISIADPMMFDPGSASLRPEMHHFLSRLALLLVGMGEVEIRVEGHTDDIPISTVAFPSNWELSAARSASLVKFFVDSGMNPALLSAVGYGEHRPLVPNINSENRAKNRRIEIYAEYVRKRF